MEGFTTAVLSTSRNLCGVLLSCFVRVLSLFFYPRRALDRECKTFKPPRVTQEQEEDAKPKKLEQVRITAQKTVCRCLFPPPLLCWNSMCVSRASAHDDWIALSGNCHYFSDAKV